MCTRIFETYALHLYEFIPFLSRFHRFCVDFSLDDEKLMNYYATTEYCTFSENIKNELIEFMLKLDNIHQCASCYDYNMMQNVDFDYDTYEFLPKNKHRSRTRFGCLIDLEDKQQIHMESFLNFKKTFRIFNLPQHNEYKKEYKYFTI